MGNLHQLLAVKKDVQQRATTIEAETKKVFGSKHLFYGSVKSYKPFDDEDQTRFADEHEQMSYTVGEKLAWFAENFGKVMDVEYQIDVSNENAEASVDIEGFHLESVPATYLLDLVGFLDRIRRVYTNIPVLDSKHQWDKDDAAGPGVFRTSEDEVTYRSKKVLRHKVLVEATDHHPAQVEKWSEDQQVGQYTKRMWSGALTAAQKATVLGRIDKLLEATKRALSEANNAEHSKEKIASKVFSFLHDGLPLEGPLSAEDL